MWIRLVELVDVIRLGEGADEPVWALDNSGKFTSKSALMELSDSPPT